MTLGSYSLYFSGSPLQSLVPSTHPTLTQLSVCRLRKYVEVRLVFGYKDREKRIVISALKISTIRWVMFLIYTSLKINNSDTMKRTEQYDRTFYRQSRSNRLCGRKYRTIAARKINGHSLRQGLKRRSGQS